MWFSEISANSLLAIWNVKHSCALDATMVLAADIFWPCDSDLLSILRFLDPVFNLLYLVAVPAKDVLCISLSFKPLRL
jgi:hypothetical protein